MALTRRGSFALNAPKVITFVISLALVIVALLSMHAQLPAGAAFVGQHRLWIVVGAYALLAAGCILPGL